MLLERDQALAAVEGLARAAAAGEGAALLVDGDAGLGKTALLASARRHADEHGVRVLAASGGEMEQELPWGVVRDLLRRPVRTAGLPLPAVLELAAVDDEVAALPVLADACAALAEQQPLLLVVDDAHWCDAPSARWLAYLAARLAGLPLALLVAARPTAARRPEALAVLAGRCPVLGLQPLSPPAVARLVRHVLPRADDDVVAACWRASQGNPFLAVELSREVATVGPERQEDVEDLALDPVGRALARRLAGAGPGARALVEVVALLGAEADPYDAYALAGLDPGAGAVAADLLRAAGVLAARTDGRLALAHPLFRLAVERTLPAGRRSLAHLAAARHLDASGADPGRVATHLLAVEPADDPWVRDRLVTAARDAAAAGAPSIARSLYERALAERLPSDDDLPVELGRVLLRVDPGAAVVPLQAACARATDRQERVALALALAEAMQGARRLQEVPPFLAQLADDLAGGGSRDGLWWRVEAELLSLAAMDPRSALRTAHLATTRTALTGAHPEERLVLVQHAVDEVSHRHAGTALRLCEQAWDDGRLDDVLTSRTSTTAMWLLHALDYAGAPETAERIGAQWLREAAPGSTDAAYLGAVVAEAQYRQGSLRAAEASAQAAWSVACELGPSFAGWWPAVGELAQVLLARGRADDAAALLQAQGLLAGPVPRVWTMPPLGVVRARVLLATGNVERGVDELQQAHAWHVSLGQPCPGAWWYRADLVDGLLALGRREDAVQVAERWRADTAGFGSPVVDGIVLRTCGLAHASVDELAAAVPLLGEGRARAELARALLEHGAALRRSGRRADARHLLQEAQALADDTGADGLAARARTELRALGVRTAAAATVGLHALTASELRVAQLAAEGRSNPQIAAALFVSRKTVEKHLSSAFDKLGVTSRHALAAALSG